MEERLFNGEERDEEVGFDISLRPLSLAEFVGQEGIKDNLKVFIEAARAGMRPLTTFLSTAFLAWVKPLLPI